MPWSITPPGKPWSTFQQLQLFNSSELCHIEILAALLCHFSISNISHKKSRIAAYRRFPFAKFNLPDAILSANSNFDASLRWSSSFSFEFGGIVGCWIWICHFYHRLSVVGNPEKDATFNFQVGRAEKREAKGAKETGAQAAGFSIFKSWKRKKMNEDHRHGDSRWLPPSGMAVELSWAILIVFKLDT